MRFSPHGGLIPFGKTWSPIPPFAYIKVSGQVPSRIQRSPCICNAIRRNCYLGIHVRRVKSIEDHPPHADLFGPRYNSKMARFYACRARHRTVYPGHAIWCVGPPHPVSSEFRLTSIAVDSTIPDYLNPVINMGISMLSKFIAVVVFSPIFLLPSVAAFAIGVLLGQVYIKAQLSVKRELSNARSPVLSHFGAAIAGIGVYPSCPQSESIGLPVTIVSIRAYSAQNSFRKESLRRIDKVTRPTRAFYNLNRWFSVRSDAVRTIFSSALAIYLVYGTGTDHKNGSAANVGFSLNMAVGFSSMILWWVRCLNEFEVSGNRWDLLPFPRVDE